ncbi:TPA: restriction endonuclease subunit S [Enterococcus faecium]|uniref:restriction endonuclease subunit S n=1 Tax=Enterococcus TaxID=1350 RepID=UPI0012E2B7DC|nr:MULTISPECIES: restriction endonuclease subunit S [Enterococcus]MBA5811963.1 restriction endonuclease subunit S [Enterococcus faecium]MDQ8485443.1 restriction endonuclease subunit S [Enterococcus faecium]MUP23965.1 restriction endonuclease subunit S [Enterococcus lactis]HAQ4707136.1 restriction endonuclease subunit S [Enterococcus faecium]HAQ5980783.1 restriction endonuclease subunit S [Enterococcus faecium]
MQEERTNVPKIRFKGYAEDWEERKVGDFLKESKIKGTDGSIAKKLTVKLWRKGVIAKEEIYSGSSATQYYIRKAGQFMYGKLDFLNQAFGIVPPELDGYESTLDSPAFDIGKNMNAIFLLEYISLVRFYKYQGTIANGSRKAKRIHVDTFLEMPLLVPSFKEQQKIGTFFKQLDDTIALHQRKLDLLKQTKKSYLQKMFPKKGEDKPEIRFAGFTDAWEQRKLGELGKTQSGIGFPDAEQGGSEGIPFFKVSDMNNIGNEYEMRNANHYVSDEQIERKKWKPIKDVPAIIFAKVGAAIMLNRKRLVTSSFLIDNNTMAYMFNNTWDIYFGKILFETINLPRYSQVGALPSYNSSDIESIDVKVPVKDEQQKIGNFFKQLDDTIALHQRELDSLKEMKKSLLQQMFV